MGRDNRLENWISYSRKVFFYETDAMGIVHHSNYVRYFEEARGYFLEVKGFPYERLREEFNLEVILSSLQVNYKRALPYGERFTIYLKPSIVNSYLFSFEYELYNSNNKLSTTGTTTHGCIDRDSKKLIKIPQVLKDIML